MKNRVSAALLAFIFGSFGVHKFYLRDPGAGVFYLIIFFVTSRFFPVSAILGVIDAIRLLMMTDEEFDRRYNRRTTRGRSYRERRRQYRSGRQEKSTDERPIKIPERPKFTNKMNPFKKSGIKKYREFDLEDAIVDFNKGLEIEPKDIALHFNIACAYSLTEQKDKAFLHITKAVEFGFKDFEKIQTHDDLAYMRIQPEFDGFKENGYSFEKGKEKSQAHQKEENNEPEIKDDVLLSQLNKLAELRKKGLLSEDEFAMERKKLLKRQ